jgi:hypothetical protein
VPVFFISTYGFWDAIIASPATEKAYFLSTSVHAALGAFTGPHPELLSNINWPGSAVK